MPTIARVDDAADDGVGPLPLASSSSCLGTPPAFVDATVGPPPPLPPPAGPCRMLCGDVLLLIVDTFSGCSWAPPIPFGRAPDGNGGGCCWKMMLPFEAVELELLMLLAVLLRLRLVRGAADGPFAGAVAVTAAAAAATAIAAAGDAEAVGTGGTGGGGGCWWRPDGPVDGAAPGGMCFNI